MRKFAVLMLFFALAWGIQAQPSKVVSTFNYLRYGKLDKAKAAIDEATVHPKTMTEAKTWFYRGNVYLAIQLSEEEQYKNLDPNPVEKAYEAYEKALKLDEKGEFTNDINDRIIVCAEQFYNSGVGFYNLQDYDNATRAFVKAATVNQGLGNIDTLSYFYAAQSAFFANQQDVAKDYFDKLISFNFKDVSVYRVRSEIYKTQGDTTMALNTIKQGRQFFPDDFSLIIAETNIYLAANEKDKAMDLLQLAITKDNTNPTLFFAVGTNYDQMGNFAEAEKSYKKAIELDNKYFDANYNLGALYVNQAIAIMEKANALPLNEEKKYTQMKEEADNLLRASIPYLEKADELQPGDVYTLRTLKDIYTRLSMLDKLKGINERLNE